MGEEKGEDRSTFWQAKNCSIEVSNGAIMPIPSIRRLESMGQTKDGREALVDLLVLSF